MLIGCTSEATFYNNSSYIIAPYPGGKWLGYEATAIVIYPSLQKMIFLGFSGVFLFFLYFWDFMFFFFFFSFLVGHPS